MYWSLHAHISAPFWKTGSLKSIQVNHGPVFWWVDRADMASFRRLIEGITGVRFWLDTIMLVQNITRWFALVEPSSGRECTSDGNDGECCEFLFMVVTDLGIGDVNPNYQICRRKGGVKHRSVVQCEQNNTSVAKKTAGGPLGDLCSCSESSRAGWASGGRRINPWHRSKGLAKLQLHERISWRILVALQGFG